MQTLFAVTDHPREGAAHIAQPGAAEGERVTAMRRGVDAPAHLVEIDDQVVDQRLVGHEPQRRDGRVVTGSQRIGPPHGVTTSRFTPAVVNRRPGIASELRPVCNRQSTIPRHFCQF